MVKTKFTIILMIFLLLVNVMSISAITGSMGNARMILYPEVNGWSTTEIEKSILVKNVNDEALNITLYATEDSDFLEVIDESFILNPNSERRAKFLVKVKKEGTYEGKINVFFTPLDGDAGVALPSTIIVIAKRDWDYQEQDEEEEETEEEEPSITGEVSMDIEIDDPKPKGILILSISTLVLMIALAGLMFLMSKNKKVKKKK